MTYVVPIELYNAMLFAFGLTQIAMLFFIWHIYRLLSLKIEKAVGKE